MLEPELLFQVINLSRRHNRRKALAIGAPGALIFHDPRGFIGDVLAELACDQM
jgi:hypothetical protein